MPHSLLLLPLHQNSCLQCDAHERLALRVLEERAKGPASEWAAYLALLPEEPRTSASLSEEDSDLLQGTYAGVVVGGVRRRVQRFVQRVKASSAVAFKDSALQWAMAVVLSRALVVGAPANLARRNVSHAHLYDTPFLAPGADLFNHSPEATVGWTLSAEGAASVRQLSGNLVLAAGKDGASAATPPAAVSVFAIVALQAYAHAGMEVFNSYHDAAGNAHLLAHHGFTLPDNAFDSIALQISASVGENGGWFGLVSAGMEEAQRGVAARLRALRERGLVSDSDVDTVMRWSGPGPFVSPNITVLLHAGGGGGGAPPTALLNLARLTVITHSRAFSAWIDSAIGSGGSAATTSAAITSTDASKARGSIAMRAEQAIWERVLETLPERAKTSEFVVLGGTGESHTLEGRASSASSVHGAGHVAGATLNTAHLLSTSLTVSLFTDALAHSILFSALAGLRKVYQRRTGLATTSSSSSSEMESEGVGDHGELLSIKMQIFELDKNCLDNGAGAVGVGWSAASSRGGGSVNGGRGRGINSAAAVAAEALRVRGPNGNAVAAAVTEAAAVASSTAAAAGSGVGSSAAAKVALKATPLPQPVRARAAAESAAKKLPALERRAAVLSLRVSERRILAQIITALVESYTRIVEQLRRTAGGTIFLATLSPEGSDEEGTVLGALELALAYAEGHVDEEEGGGSRKRRGGQAHRARSMLHRLAHPRRAAPPHTVAFVNPGRTASAALIGRSTRTVMAAGIKVKYN